MNFWLLLCKIDLESVNSVCPSISLRVNELIGECMRISTKKWFQILVVVFLTSLSYLNIFQNSFVSDDKTFVGQWAINQHFENIPAVFLGKGPPFREEATYRPVRDSLYIIYGQVFGNKPFGYHLHSILVHLGSTVLVYLIVEQLVGSRLWVVGRSKEKSTTYLPFVTAFLFGVHPIHTEAITFMTSSMDMIGPLFMFVSFWLYLKSRTQTNSKRMLTSKYLLVSVVLALLAFFSYELTLVLPVLFVVTDWLLMSDRIQTNPSTSLRRNLKRIIANYLPYFVAAAFYLLVRVFLIGRGLNEANYWLDSGFNYSRLMGPEVIIKYISLLFLPVDLSISHIIRPGFETFLNWVNDGAIFDNYSKLPNLLWLFSLIVVFFASFFARRRLPFLTLGVVWFFCSILPVANILAQPTVLSERYVYIASFGYCLVAAWLLCELRANIFRIYANERIATVVFWVVFGSLVVCYSTITFLRNSDWRNGLTLWESVLRVYPRSALANNNIALFYYNDKKLDDAAFYYQKALEIRPAYAHARLDFANTLRELGDLEAAESQYKKAIEINPGLLKAYVRLADLYAERARYDLAYEYLNQATTVKRESTPLTEAEFNESLSEIYKYIGYVFLKLGKIEDSNSAFKRAIEINSENSDAQSALFGLMQQNPSIWPVYKAEQGFLFSYPDDWFVDEVDGNYTISSSDNHFKIELDFDSKENETALQYIENLSEPFKELVIQEQIKIDGWDKVYARVVKDEEYHKVQFFLFRGDKIVRILAYPSQLELRQIVDGVISTIKNNE